MSTIIEEFATREDRDIRYKVLREKRQKHVGKFSTSKLHEYVIPETGEIKTIGVDVYCVSIGV